MKKLTEIKAVVMDMDGTFYLGHKLLPGSLRFLEFLNRRGMPFSFLTNNSTRSVEDYQKKLIDLGLEQKDCRVYTSGAATIRYIQNHYPGKPLHLMGTASLAKSFAEAGLSLDEQEPELMVLAYDNENTYAKLADFCLSLRRGLPYIATHPDINFPDPRGYLPDAGAYMALIKASTGREPDAIIGKPSAEILLQLAEQWGLKPEELLMVGDRLYTDIKLAEIAGAMSALVLTGEASRADIEASGSVPDLVCEDLQALLDTFLEETGEIDHG